MKRGDWTWTIGGTIVSGVVAALAGWMRDYGSPELDGGLLLLQGIGGAVVGTFIGATIDIYRKLYSLRDAFEKLLERAERRLKEAGEVLDYQGEALSILVKADRHSPVLEDLLRTSLRAKCRDIALFTETDYLKTLEKCISASEEYYGTQIYPVRWFRGDPKRQQYLNRLRDANLRSKLRLFIVDNAKEMEADLKDQELMKFYWDNTGDVHTYWCSRSVLDKELGGNLTSQEEIAIYDKRLLIQYRTDLKTLTFDLLGEDDSHSARKILKILETQREYDVTFPFTEVPRM